MTAPVLLVFFSRDPDARERAARRRPGRAGRASSRAGSSPGSSTSTPTPRSRRPCRSSRSRSSWPSSTAARCRCSRTSLPLEELRTALTQVGAAADHPGHHRPAPAPLGPAPAGGRGGGRAQVDPRYAAAEDALGDGDIDAGGRGVPEARRRQPGRHRGRRRARDGPGCCSAPRASTSTPPAPRRGRDPDDVDAQTMVADLDMLGGHVEDAFDPARQPGPPHVRRRPEQGPRAPRSASSRPSATTTRACCGPPEPGLSALLTSRFAEHRRAAGLEPRDRAPGTASTRRSPGPPRRRSGWTPGRRRARRRRRGAGRAWPRGRARRPSRPAADALGVEGLERRDREHARARGRCEERRLDVVAGEAPRHLGQVVGAEREELGGPRRSRGQSRRHAAARSSCRPVRRSSTPALLLDLAATAVDPAPDQVELADASPPAGS